MKVPKRIIEDTDDSIVIVNEKAYKITIIDIAFHSPSIACNFAKRKRQEQHLDKSRSVSMDDREGKRKSTRR